MQCGGALDADELVFWVSSRLVLEVIHACGGGFRLASSLFSCSIMFSNSSLSISLTPLLHVSSSWASSVTGAVVSLLSSMIDEGCKTASFAI